MPLAVRAPLSGPGTPRCPAPQLVTNRFTGSAVLYGTPSTKNGIILTQNINTASSAAQRAADELSSARDQLAGALALIGELDKALDSPDPLPKGHGSKVADAQAQAQQLQRLVKRREASLSEAQAGLRQAETQAKADRINELADLLAEFDRETFLQEVLADLQPALDKHLAKVHALKDAERELLALAGKDHLVTDRVTITNDSYRDIVIDDVKIYRLAPQSLAENAGAKLIDSRHQAEIDEALAEDRRQAQAERDERDAQNAENRRLTDAARGPAPAGARVSRDRDGKEIWMRPATAHKAGHSNR